MNSDRNFHTHQAPGRPGLRKSAGPAAASALLAVLLYSITLGGTYVYDDVQVVHDDPRVRQPRQWVRLWNSDYFDGGIDNLYRPITSSSYAVEWWLHGDRPWIFHGVNIFLHALAAAGIAEFTRRALSGASNANAAAHSAGLLFAAHPVHAEAVANIVGRAELLCTACIFGGLILLCRRPLQLGRIGVVIVIAIIAVLSKEQGILQPLLWLFFGLIIWRFLSYSPTFTEPQQAETARLAEIHTVKIFVLINNWIWAAHLLIREHFLRFEWDRTYIDPIVQPMIRSHGLDRILMPVVLVGHYTALLLWPAHLAVDYGADAIGSIVNRTDPYLWIGAISIALWIVATGICLLLFLTGRSTAKSRFALFCLLCVAITYGIIGNMLTLIATNFAERLIYLPSAFLLMLAGILISQLPFKPRVALLVVILIPTSVRTIYAARDWNHPLVLYEHGIANQPKSLQLHLLLSQQYHLNGNSSGATLMVREATLLYPDYWRAWMFRASDDLDNEDLPDAERSLKRGIKLKAEPALLVVSDRLEKMKAATQSSH